MKAFPVFAILVAVALAGSFAFLRGPLISIPSATEAGGTTRIVIRNDGFRPVVLNGLLSDCGCMTPLNLPLEVPARSRATMEVAADAEALAGASLRLMTSEFGELQVVVGDFATSGFSR